MPSIAESRYSLVAFIKFIPMKIVFNETFARYLSAYGLPPDLSFPCDLPAEVSDIINSDILFTELGVTLSALNKLRARLAKVH